MSASDFLPLFTLAGSDATLYTRSLGSESSTTQWRDVSWVNAGTVRVVMYRLSNRLEESPETSGITEQRWYIVCQTKLPKDSRVAVGTDYYVIETEPSIVRIGGNIICYECEAVRELLKT
jgi:hypothetical protein